MEVRIAVGDRCPMQARQRCHNLHEPIMIVFGDRLRIDQPLEYQAETGAVGKVETGKQLRRWHRTIPQPL